ncbi:aminoacyl-tRNA hydrolase [Candidatus Phytoplasma ziziphi]|uniref:Peptidyl-tRNA hydrolase n=1 Tax=Ziziphus jujuba witches'-broom phytoplasma TaxID=135727 RepID=A0A660HN06_ZIZJU|nr:aminoacyl-tRNA hydrolase [Candidatus Phytoplasma ziziphi]AYJ01430.1 aminoacyl-tRNA hydrolase [Candidatus Phytoplasma ziziphi]
MKLIVGLGNPGIIYNNTPHNIGFMMVDFFLDYLKKNLIPFKLKKELFNLVYHAQINKKSIILLKPQIYMNNSGSAIEKIVKKYKINTQDILVLYDDIYLKAGNFKLKHKGGHGGHNGIKNIIETLNTNQFKRLKIGVDNNFLIPLNEYVLRVFESQIKKDILNNFPIFIDILKYFIDDAPFEKIFNFLNKK